MMWRLATATVTISTKLHAEKMRHHWRNSHMHCAKTTGRVSAVNNGSLS
jgi:hypothetical protein